MQKWTEEFNTEHRLLNAQHSLLLSHLNRLELFTRNTNPSPEEVEMFTRALEALEKHAIAHFKSEEACLLQQQCPAHEETQRAHAEFLAYYRGFLNRLRFEGCRPDLVRELHRGCRDWIEKHIPCFDLQLRAVASQSTTISNPD